MIRTCYDCKHTYCGDGCGCNCDAARSLDKVRALLSENGCDCTCEHHYEEHDDECELCLACRVGEVMK